MPSQQTAPSTAPAAAAPLAQLSQFYWKPPLLTGVTPLHSHLAWRQEAAAVQPFRALQPLDERSQLIVDSHDAIVSVVKGLDTDHVRSSLSNDPIGLSHQAAHNIRWVSWTDRSLRSAIMSDVIALRYLRERSRLLH